MSKADALADFKDAPQWTEIDLSAQQPMDGNLENHSAISSDHFVGQPGQQFNRLAQFIAPYDNLQYTTSSSNDSLFPISYLPTENESLLSDQLHNVILVLFYSLIVIVSLFGNIFVCRVMLSLKGNNRTTTNFLILNLALSDLLLTMYNIPVNLVRFVSSDWPFGSFICTATPFIQSLSAHCSSITMMVIAFERHSRLIGANPILIPWNFIKTSMLRLCCLSSNFSNGQMTQTSLRSSIANNRANSKQSWPSIRIMVFIWLFSALLSIPHGMVNKVVIRQSVFRVMSRCAAKYPSDSVRKWLTIITLLSQYIVPIGLTAFFYARIGFFLWRRSDPVGVVSEGRRQSILRRKRKRVVMLMVVVAVFAGCWLPLHLYVFLMEFELIQHSFGIFFCVHWLAMSSVVWNSIIYTWLNENFRRKTKSLLTIFRPFKSCFERVLNLVNCCGCSKGEPASMTDITATTGSQNDVKARSGSDESGQSNCRDMPSTLAAENGLAGLIGQSNGSKKKCPELAVEMTTVLEVSECDG